MQITYTQKPTPPNEYSRALLHHQQQDYLKAKILYLKYLEKNPQKAEAWVNLASVCDFLKEYDEALLHIEQALRLDSKVRSGQFNLGIILLHRHNYPKAIKAFETCLQRNPKDHEAQHYLGRCYYDQKQFQKALEHYTIASDAVPSFLSIYGAGQCYLKMNRYKLAVVCFSECLKIKPNDDNSLLELIACYKFLHDYEKLAETLKLLKESEHLNWAQKLELYFVRRLLALWNEEIVAGESLTQALEKALQEGRKILIDPFSAMVLPLSLETRLRIARTYAAAIEDKTVAQKPSLQPATPRKSSRLRIAYLSYDIRQHASGYLTQNLFKHHDKSRFEIFIYSYAPDDGSSVRQNIAKSVEHFVDVEKETTSAIAERIAADGIDVLVDLMGFTQGNRFEILALRPAPIQINYLGFCLSTGSSAIDYFMVDKTVVRPNEEACYSEKLIYLPHTMIPINDAEAVDLHLAGTRSDWGLPENAFVYGCFNAIYKLDLNVFSIWMQILKAVPDSVLWLLSAAPSIIDHLRQQAQSLGLDPNRLIFSERKPRAEHLARHIHMDVFLDSFQVNAITTACDALMAGVPVLTLAGDFILNRAGRSIVEAAGPAELMTHFVAENVEDYQQKAIHYALDFERFKSLKQGFQKQWPESPLMNSKAKVAAFEKAYEKVWDLHQQGEKPQSLEVAAI